MENNHLKWKLLNQQHRTFQRVLFHVARLVETQTFLGGTEIVKQGEDPSTFYIIRSGSVKIIENGVYHTFYEGEYFGELACLMKTKLQATVVANDPEVVCLTLTNRHFINKFGEVNKFKEILIKPQAETSKWVYTSELHKDIQLEQLKTEGVPLLDAGTIRIDRVKHSKDGKEDYYALKRYNTTVYDRFKKQIHEGITIQMQAGSKSEFITRLFRTYEDHYYLYLLMEYCPNDLSKLNIWGQRNAVFLEEQVKFATGCIIQALSYLHDQNIIYRNLYMSNVLLSSNGYFKLNDFAFAERLGKRAVARSFRQVTFKNDAPEIVSRYYHDKSVDYWALGLILYEMLTGSHPFDDSSQSEMKKKILTGLNPVCLNRIKKDARNLVEKLCHHLAMDRLGMQKNGIKDIRSHLWFNEFSWGALSKCEMPSPFMIFLESDT